MPYDVEPIRETTRTSPFEPRITALRVTGLPEEYFGEETAELYLEETDEGGYRAYHERTSVHEHDHLVDAVASALTVYWRGHPVPGYGAGDEFVLHYGEDGERTEEYVAKTNIVLRKKDDWEDDDPSGA